MKCIICRERNTAKNNVQPHCRCTKKTPICKGCYDSVRIRLNLECTICMTKFLPEPVQTIEECLVSHRILRLIVEKMIDPIILPLINASGWQGLLIYMILSIFFTLFILIPWAIIIYIEISIRHNIEDFWHVATLISYCTGLTICFITPSST